MKLRLFIFLLLLVLQFKFSLVKSQKLIGNEWINYNQSYLKFVIDQTGIYKISKDDLGKNGFDTSKINPKNLQLFFRGRELAISIKGESDNKFDDNDFIEFFAIKNDGEQDSVVYRPRVRPNKFLSIYSPNTAYFLTYNPNTLGKRIVENTFFNQSIEPEQYYISKVLKVFDEDWNYDIGTGGVPSLVQSYFEPNETLVSTPIVFQGAITDHTNIHKLENYIQNTKTDITFESVICSRYDARKVISVSVANQNSKIALENFKFGKTSANISSHQSDILPIKYNFESSNSPNMNDGKKFDMFSILYYQIKYPRKPIFLENSEYEILPKDNNIKSILKLSVANEKIIGFDIADIYNQKKLNTKFDTDLKEISVSIENSNNKVWLSSTFLKPKTFETVNFKKENYSTVDYIIVTDTTLINGANKFKAYRESNLGGNHKITLAVKQRLFDEFSYGERNPIAINRFIENVFKYSKPKYLLLLGKSRSTPTIFKTNELEDLTPTMGFPASDALLSAGINGKSIDLQSLATGRLAALTNEHIIDYLEKVKEYEAYNKNVSWKKRVLHLGGGRGEGQINEFKSFLGKLGEISKNSKLGSEFSMMNKANALVGTENIDISKQINDGIGVLTFIGHSSSQALDLNIGFVSEQKANFKNGPLYPFMFFNGCAAGNVFVKAQSLTNDWIITPKKGAIAVLAHSYLSYSTTNIAYMEKLYKTWFSSVEMLNKPIGEVVQIVNENIIKDNPNDIYMIANTQQLILQGDPAIKIFNIDKPDFEIDDNKLFLSSNIKNKAVAVNDSLKLGIVSSNLGIFEKGSKLNLTIRKTYNDGKNIDKLLTIDAFGFNDTTIVQLKKELNMKQVEVILDSDEKIIELNEANNIAKITFNWETLKNTEYYSTASFVDQLNPTLTVKVDGKVPYNGIEITKDANVFISLIDENSLGIKSDKLEVFIKKICDTCQENSIKINIDKIDGGIAEILANVSLKNLEVGSYQLFIQGFDEQKNSSGEVFTFNFKIIESNSNIGFKLFPNPMSINTFTKFEIEILENMSANNANYSINIFDILGKSVYLSSGKLKVSKNEIYWDGKSNTGNDLPEGTYIYNVDISFENKNTKFKGRILLK